MFPLVAFLSLFMRSGANSEVPSREEQAVAARSAAELIHKQEPMKVNPEAYAKATPENTSIVVDLETQRAVLLAGGEIAIDTPISSGKRTGATQTGIFAIREKLKSHQSSMHGRFVDKRGRTVKAGVSMKIDAAPAGTNFVADPMPYFSRFTENGFGIHGGALPGYPASHGSIRVPEGVARLIFEKIRVGTPMEIRGK